MIFQFKDGFPNRGLDPQDTGEELEKIRRGANGVLEEETVVKVAKSRSNPLHPFFEWDDRIAAHKFRLEECRALIRAVIVESPTQDGEDMRYYVNVTHEGHEDKVYMPTTVALRTPSLREQVLNEALRELKVYERKYAHLKELSLVIDAIHKTEKKLKKR